MFAFLLAGLMPFAWKRHRQQTDPRAIWYLISAALLGSAASTFFLGWIPPVAIRLFVATVVLASGVSTLLSFRLISTPASSPSTAVMALAGLVVGCGSALSGTSGPVMLIPILLAVGMPVKTAIALAQIIQLPIALSASAINLHAGRLDLGLGAGLGLVLVVGYVIGVLAASRVPIRYLRIGVAAILVSTGIWYAYVALS